MPVSGGSRKKKYVTKCKICKKADNKLFDMRDHKCPYCQRCWEESGWKKIAVPVTQCTDELHRHQAESEGEGNDDHGIQERCMNRHHGHQAESEKEGIDEHDIQQRAAV